MSLESEMISLRNEVEYPVRTPVLAIAGLGRSGSTVIEAALGAGQRGVVLGEVMHIWERSIQRNELCGCGRPFHECPFWGEVGERAFGGWDRVDAPRLAAERAEIDRVVHIPRMGTRLGRGAFRFALKEYSWHYEQIYAAAVATSGADYVIDSSKQPSLVHALATSPRLDVRVLHIVRDPRAVAYAWTKVVARPEARDEESAYMTRYTPAQTARHWMVHNLAVEGLRARNLPIERVRYEDFVADPVGTTARLRAFAGEPHTDSEAVTAESIEVTGTQHSCSGNPMRLRGGPLVIRADEKWRAALPARDARLVSALTAPLSLRYGYDLGAS